MEVDPSDINQQFLAGNNPYYVYCMRPINRQTEPSDEYFTRDEFKSILQIQQMISRPYKKSKKCIRANCNNIIKNDQRFKRLSRLVNRHINQLRPLVLKTNHEFVFRQQQGRRLTDPKPDPKPDPKLTDPKLTDLKLTDPKLTDSIPSAKKIDLKVTDPKVIDPTKPVTEKIDPKVNASLNKCLVLPKPSEYSARVGTKPFLKIINNDEGYILNAIDIDTGQSTDIHSSTIAGMSNRPHKVMESLKNIPLKTGTPVSAIQGRSSLMRRKELSRLATGSIRTTTLGHPLLTDALILPISMKKPINMPYAKTIPPHLFFRIDEEAVARQYLYPLPFDVTDSKKRDPAINLGSNVYPTRIGFYDDDAGYNSHMIMGPTHFDCDGDEIVDMFSVGFLPRIESTLNASMRYAMVLPFNHTRVVFAQSQAFVMYRKRLLGYEHIFDFVRKHVHCARASAIQEIRENMGRFLASVDSMHAHNLMDEQTRNRLINPDFTMTVINGVLLLLAQVHGSRVAFEFMELVLSASTCYLSGKPHPALISIDDDDHYDDDNHYNNRNDDHYDNDNHYNNRNDGDGNQNSDDHYNNRSNGDGDGKEKGRPAQPCIGLITNDLLHPVLRRIIGSEAKGNFSNYQEILDRVATLDQTLRIQAVDNTTRETLCTQEKQNTQTANQMIGDSGSIWEVGYKLNSWCAFFAPITVDYGNMICYNNQPLINVHELIDSSLIINPMTALYILLLNVD